MRYLKLYEGFESVNSINWEMIENIKDMSLEYLDDGCMLGLYVYGVPNGEGIYKFHFSHEIGVQEEWGTKNRPSKNYISLYHKNSDELGKICYVVILYNKFDKLGRRNPEISNELIDRIKEAYPNEDIRSS